MNRKEAEKLVADERGAIMIMGLGAAMLLIGALWLLMGVADTVVFKEKMQEAVDSAAFGSAAVHAYGMNFIAALNLVILGMVTVHLVLGLVADVLGIVAGILLVPPATEFAPVVWEWGAMVREAQTIYAMNMLPAAIGIGGLQTAAAVVVPYIGRDVATDAGDFYGQKVEALGASNFPGGIAFPDKEAGTKGKLSFALTGLGGVRLGLPVAYEPMNDMCKRPFFWVADWLSASFQKFPIVAKTLAAVQKMPGGSLIAPRVKELINETFRGIGKIVGDSVVAIECNDGLMTAIKNPLKTIAVAIPGWILPLGGEINPLWAAPGAKKIWGTAKNDSQWMQIWSWTVDANRVDDEERKVAIARRKFGDVGTTTLTGLRYVAQAEFYYDCTGSDQEWYDIGCQAYSSESQLSLYNMRWRARLRRYREPDFGAFGMDVILGALDGFDIITKTLAKIPGVGQKISGVSDVGKLVRKAIDDVILNKTRSLLVNQPDGTIIH